MGVAPPNLSKIQRPEIDLLDLYVRGTRLRATSPGAGSWDPFVPKRALSKSGGRVSNPTGGTVARRTNYGFEKRQRELRRKNKKEEKKAARRGREEAPSSAPGNDAATEEKPTESRPGDRG